MSRVPYVLLCAVALVMAGVPVNTDMLATANGERQSNLPGPAELSAPAGTVSELTPGPVQFFDYDANEVDTLHWDGPYSDNAVGLTAGGTFFAAVRLTPDKDVSLTNVIWVSHDPPTTAHIFIWGPGTATTPGAMLDSVVSTTGSMQWVNVAVPRRDMPSGSDFWVGVRVTHAAGQFPVGVDAGPAVAQRGGFINYDGSWTELRTVGLNFNWNIRAIVETGAPAAKDVGVSAILAPTGTITPRSVAPLVTIRNYGTEAQTDIPVHITIEDIGAADYTGETTYPGPLEPGTTANVLFPVEWDATEGQYRVTCWTALSGDEKPGNDTARASLTVQEAVYAWEQIPQPATMQDRIVHATVYHPGTDMIFQIGGNPAGETGSYDGLNRAFDPAGAWETKASMPTPLGWCGYGLVDDTIYMIGGHNNASGFVANNQAYNIADNTWTAKAPRPGTAVGAVLSATWNNELIYVMGGLGTAGVNRVDIYRPSDNTWMVGTALPRAAFMGSAVIVGNTIYIAQAYDGSACWTHFYTGEIDPSDPTQITWTQGPALSEPVFNGATVAIDNDVYWIGGFINATTVTDKVWRYRAGTITPFTPVYPVTIARNTFAAVRDNGDVQEIYGMGGDQNGDWAAPNRIYVKLNMAGVGVEDTPEPLRAVFEAVRPTLVRDRAVISYSVSRAGQVNLGVFDASGRLVRTLVNGPVLPGAQSATWDRRDDGGRRVSNGTYFYRLTVDSRTFSAKSVVLN